MDNVVMEMEGDVHVLKNITGTKQLRDFYNQVVRNNWEKYVGITTQGIRYGFNSDKNSAIRLPDAQMFAYNPNYRSSKITEDTKKAVQAETVAQEEAKSETSVTEKPAKEKTVVNTVESKPQEKKEEVKQKEPEQKVEDKQEVKPVDYHALFVQEQNKTKQLQQSLAALQVQVRTQSERATLAESQITKLMQSKVSSEGAFTQAKTDLASKDNKIAELTAEVEKLRKATQSAQDSAAALSTDALIKLLADKGYKVTISK